MARRPRAASSARAWPVQTGRTRVALGRAGGRGGEGGGEQRAPGAGGSHLVELRWRRARVLPAAGMRSTRWPRPNGSSAARDIFGVTEQEPRGARSMEGQQSSWAALVCLCLFEMWRECNCTRLVAQMKVDFALARRSGQKSWPPSGRSRPRDFRRSPINPQDGQSCESRRLASCAHQTADLAISRPLTRPKFSRTGRS